MSAQFDGGAASTAPDPAASLPAMPPAKAPDTWLSPAAAWYGVGMIAAVTVFGQLDRGIMSLLVGSIKRDTGMSDTQISLLLGLAYSIAYMGCGLPMARLTDVRRRTFILPAALAVWSAGTILCGIVQNYWAFFASRMLIGAGESVKAPTSTSLIPDYVRRHHLPRAFALYNVAIMGGEALSLILGGLLLGWFAAHAPFDLPGIGRVHDWQMVYFVFGLPGIALAILFVTTVKEPARQGRKVKGSVPIRDIWTFMTAGPARRVMLPSLLSACVASIYAVGAGAWRPAFIERTYGLSPAEYGPITGTVSLVTLPIGIILGTWIVEKMVRRWDDGHLRLVLLIELLTIPFAIASPLMPTFELVMVCQFFSGTFLIMGAPAKQAAMQIITPNEMRGQIAAIYMFTVGVLGQGLGPTIVALMTDYVFQDEAGLRYAILTAAVVAAPTMALCTSIALRPYGRLHRAAIDADHGR